jgi:hypothetical protein
VLYLHSEIPTSDKLDILIDLIIYSSTTTRVPTSRPYPGSEQSKGTHPPEKISLSSETSRYSLKIQRDHRSCQFGTHQNPMSPSHLPPWTLTGNTGTETLVPSQVRERQGSRSSGGQGRETGRQPERGRERVGQSRFLPFLGSRARAHFASANVMMRGVARQDPSLFLLALLPAFLLIWLFQLNETRFGTRCDSTRTSKRHGTDPVPSDPTQKSDRHFGAGVISPCPSAADRGVTKLK